MNKNTKALLLLVLVLLFGFGFWNLRLRNQKTVVQNEKTVVEYSANLTISNGQDVKSYDVSQFIGKSALEATNAVLDGKITTNGTGTNAFVTSLNGRIADPKKHEFWELDENGAETQVGAGSYIIQNSDKIEWKINTY